MTTDEPHLAGLMSAAQSGDTEAYERLLEAVTPLIRRVVWRQRAFLGPDGIEDLVQEILLSVHAVRATYDTGRPFMPWLLAIVRNRLADGARRHARTSAHEINVGDLDVTFSPDFTNSEDESYRDRQALQRAVVALPATQRQAIELLKLREMSLKEAAAAGQTTVGALKVATHRAMAALRQTLTRAPTKK